jgi:catechol 2,3-dioxygenase-like lactoylglutathione lyase family enzyme
LTLFVGSAVINTPDMQGSVDFWTQALGYVVRDSVDPNFTVLTDPHRRWSNVSLQHTDEPKRGFNRLHLDLYSDDRDAEVERLQGLGATRVEPWPYQPDHDHIVMAAPDGTEFCVVQSPYTQGP